MFLVSRQNGFSCRCHWCLITFLQESFKDQRQENPCLERHLTYLCMVNSKQWVFHLINVSSRRNFKYKWGLSFSCSFLQLRTWKYLYQMKTILDFWCRKIRYLFIFCDHTLLTKRNKNIVKLYSTWALNSITCVAEEVISLVQHWLNDYIKILNYYYNCSYLYT